MVDRLRWTRARQENTRHPKPYCSCIEGQAWRPRFQWWRGKSHDHEMKTIFVKVKDMIELVCSSEERAAIHECRTHYPLNLLVTDWRVVMRKAQRLSLHYHSKKSNENINRNKKTKRKKFASNQTSLVCHCCRKKGHNTASYWYSVVCSFCGNKGHHVASHWEKQATSHKPSCFRSKNGKKIPPIQQQTHT